MASSADASEGGKKKGAATIMLISADNERFEVLEAVASLSHTISNMIEDNCTDGGLPLPNVTGRVLAKVLEYCNRHAAAASAAATSSGSSSDCGGSSGSSKPAAADASKASDLAAFDKEFVDVDLSVLFDVLMAANYLEIKGLLDIAAQKVADLIKGKMPEEIRKTFGIENDLTPEEEEEIRRENAWAFED